VAEQAQPHQFSHLLAIRAGLEIELVEGFDPRKACLAQLGFDAALVPALPLILTRLDKKGFVVFLALGCLLADSIQLSFQVIHLQLVEERVQFHLV
jgi:hypothetical protein